MVIKVLVEGGVPCDNRDIGTSGNEMIRKNSAALREALHIFFEKALDKEDIDIKVSVAGGYKAGFKQFVLGENDDYFYTDLDRKPESREDWFLQLKNEGFVYDDSIKTSVFFWIPEMEAWFLKQPKAIMDWIEGESIRMTKTIDIAEDNNIKGKGDYGIEHLQHKPSEIMNTIFQRYLLSDNDGNDGKPRKLQYGKLRHAPRIIRYLDPKEMINHDKELKRFVETCRTKYDASTKDNSRNRLQSQG